MQPTENSNVQLAINIILEVRPTSERKMLVELTSPFTPLATCADLCVLAIRRTHGYPRRREQH